MKPWFMPTCTVELIRAVHNTGWVFFRELKDDESLFHAKGAVHLSKGFVAGDCFPLPFD